MIKLTLLSFILTLSHIISGASYGASIDGKEIIGIEVILAGASDRSINSRFGHAFLRLVDNDKRWSNDIVFSFGFEVDPNNPLSKIDEIKSSIKGDFPLVMNKTFLGELWNRYELYEVRNLSRHIIPTTAESRELLIENLKENLESNKDLGRYSLLSRNCLTVVVELLKDSEIPLRTRGTIMPTSINKLLFESGLSWLTPFKFKSKKEVIASLGLTNIFSYFTEEEFSDILANWSDENIKVLLAYQFKLNVNMLQRIRSERGLKNSRQETEKIIGHEKLSPLLYQVCESRVCHENKYQYIGNKFGQKKLKEIKLSLKRHPNFTDPNRDKDFYFNRRNFRHNRVRTPNRELYEKEFDFIQDQLLKGRL